MFQVKALKAASRSGSVEDNVLLLRASGLQQLPQLLQINAALALL